MPIEQARGSAVTAMGQRYRLPLLKLSKAPWSILWLLGDFRVTSGLLAHNPFTARETVIQIFLRRIKDSSDFVLSHQRRFGSIIHHFVVCEVVEKQKQVS